jgi:hypothetical protein
MRKTLIGTALVAVTLLFNISLLAQVVTVPKGTPIRLRLAETLQCENSHPGDSIAFEVTDSIKIDGDTVIPANALAYGRIADGTTPTRPVGRGGRVAFDLLYVTDITGREIPISEDRYVRGRGRGTEIILHEITSPSPLWLLIEGHHIKFPEGKTIVVITAAEKDVDLTKLRANLRNQNPTITPASTPSKPSTPQVQQVAHPSAYTLSFDGTMIASR